MPGVLANVASRVVAGRSDHTVHSMRQSRLRQQILHSNAIRLTWMKTLPCKKILVAEKFYPGENAISHLHFPTI